MASQASHCVSRPVAVSLVNTTVVLSVVVSFLLCDFRSAIEPEGIVGTLEFILFHQRCPWPGTPEIKSVLRRTESSL